jgi:hypothetical protein
VGKSEGKNSLEDLRINVRFHEGLSYRYKPWTGDIRMRIGTIGCLLE